MFLKKSKNNRTQQLSKLAYDLDMQFYEKEEFGLKSRLNQFQLFQQNGTKQIINLFIKEDQWHTSNIAIFDLKILDDNDDMEESYQTVFFIDSKELGLPAFYIRPEGFFDRVGKFLRLSSEIEFEEHPEFCKNYWVKGEEESLIKKMVTEDFVRFFTIEKKWQLEGMNYFLIFYQNKRLLHPKEIKDFYKKGIQLFEWIKD